MTKRRLVTAALPYANNIPHLGNLVQVLSGDAFARFCRQRGHETLYVCGTDEYGTATETRAAEEGTSPRELCDRYHSLHSAIYKWFGIEFDRFGRTSSPIQTQVVQEIFADLDRAGFVTENEVSQLHCPRCDRFLADRFVRGECPHCGSGDARGDQCESCGKLLDPTDLVAPRCHVCATAPSPRTTRHLYIDLPGIKDRLEAWIAGASGRGFWARNAVQMTQAWIRDGLRERAITRDLKWGIPVPKPGYEGKVFYVWFDAPIGYISITGSLGEALAESGRGSGWRDFVRHWWKSPDEVELFQFIGKDNIPFHTVVFPSTLLGSGGEWTMLHHMSSTEYLNYEGGKFSKSRGVGVFGNDAAESGIPADVWRFYLFYNRPEKADFMFTWKDFQEKVNGELIGNFGNLVNRTLSFIVRYFDGKVPEGAPDPAVWERVREFQRAATERLERAELREAFRETLALSSFANKLFQDSEPWRLRTEDPPRAAAVIRDIANILRDIAVMLHPFLPRTAESVGAFLGIDPFPAASFRWETLGTGEGLNGSRGVTSRVLFSKLEDDEVEKMRERFSGNQQEREVAAEVLGKEAALPAGTEAPPPPRGTFEETLDLRVAKIESVERHPKADKLYVIGLEVGEGVGGEREERTIVSGLVPFYAAEELAGRRIIVAYNLKPAKLRGIMSQGMLLAAGDNGGTSDDGSPAERCEVLDAGDAPTGTRLLPEGAVALAPPAEIDIDTFFSFPIEVADFAARTDGRNLCLDGRPIRTSTIRDGKVN